MINICYTYLIGTAHECKAFAMYNEDSFIFVGTAHEGRVFTMYTENSFILVGKLIAHSNERMKEIISNIKDKTGVTNIVSLPEIKLLKLKLLLILIREGNLDV